APLRERRGWLHSGRAPRRPLAWLRAAMRAARDIFGGHRRMTHSLVTSALLAVLSIVLWFAILPIPALVVAALLWGQLLHLVSDIPTPGGVPFLWPIRARPLVLPYPLVVLGEPAVAVGPWSVVRRSNHREDTMENEGSNILQGSGWLELW